MRIVGFFPRAAALAPCALLSLVPRAARADEHRSVSATLAGAPAAVDRLARVLSASFAHQGLDFSARRVDHVEPLDVARVAPSPSPSPVGPIAYLWLDLAAEPPTLFLVDAQSGSVYARPLAVHADPDVVETELIRFVVDRSVDAILKGSAPGVSREEFERSLQPAPARAPSPVSAPPAAESSPSADRSGRRDWGLALGYSASAPSATVLAQGPELALELREPQFRLNLTLESRFPLTVTRESVELRLQTLGARLAFELPLTLGSGFVATFGLGGGVDATHVSPDATGAVSAFWATDPLALALVNLEKSWGSVFVSARVGADWDLIAARYLVQRTNSTSAVWTPWRIRPFAGVRLGYVF